MLQKWGWYIFAAMLYVGYKAVSAKAAQAMAGGAKKSKGKGKGVEKKPKSKKGKGKGKGPGKGKGGKDANRSGGLACKGGGKGFWRGAWPLWT